MKEQFEISLYLHPGQSGGYWYVARMGRDIRFFETWSARQRAVRRWMTEAQQWGYAVAVREEQ